VKIEEIFTDIYQTNAWNGRESVSGVGSDSNQTVFLVKELSLLLKKLEIASMLDIPCGDFNWMKKVDFTGQYIGADIVEPIIASNQDRYGSPHRKFEVLNIISDKLPKVDLILTRDCLVHLSNQQILKALANIKASGAKYLLATTYLWQSKEFNKNIKTGQWRRVNLHQEPFNLPYPEELIVEGNTWDDDRDKSLGLWKLDNV
jgi:hypothetical protein